MTTAVVSRNQANAVVLVRRFPAGHTLLEVARAGATQWVVSVPTAQRQVRFASAEDAGVYARQVQEQADRRDRRRDRRSAKTGQD